jgi:hypothetical protein
MAPELLLTVNNKRLPINTLSQAATLILTTVYFVVTLFGCAMGIHNK